MAIRSRSRSRDDDEVDEREERSSRRRSRDDDRDDEPRGRRSRDREENDDDDDSREGARSRRSRGSDRSESRGRGRRGRDDDDSGDDDARGRGRSSRSSSRDRDDDDPPRRGRGRRSSQVDEGSSRRGRGTGRGTRGWDSYKSKKISGGDFVDEFKPSDHPNKDLLFHFVDDVPFDSFNQHFFRELPQGERKSFVCLDDPEYFGKEADDGCPLDAIGDKPRSYALFNVVDMSKPRRPQLKIWKVPVTVAEMIERIAEEDRTSPINREDLYFTVKAVEGKNKVTYNIQPVKERDLGDDFDAEPLTDEELDEFEAERYDDRTAIQKVDTYEDLEELADSLTRRR